MKRITIFLVVLCVSLVGADLYLWDGLKKCDVAFENLKETQVVFLYVFGKVIHVSNEHVIDASSLSSEVVLDAERSKLIIGKESISPGHRLLDGLSEHETCNGLDVFLGSVADFSAVLIYDGKTYVYGIAKNEGFVRNIKAQLCAK